MGYIDADTHVLECEETWDHFDPSERDYRPITLEYPGASGPGADSRKQYYVIGDTVTRRFHPSSQTWGYGKDYSPDVSFMRNPSARLREMDELGVDVQIIFSTDYLTVNVDNPMAEAALARSYNRWIAERTADARQRFRWIIVAPTLNHQRCIEEFKFGKANGAAGFMMKADGENGRLLDDPYFFPLYEVAQDLDLTVCIHAGSARKRLEGLPFVFNYRKSTVMGTPPNMMKAVYALIVSKLSERFPRLRFAFLEGGSMWLPTVFTHLERNTALLSPKGWVHTPEGTAAVVELMDPQKVLAADNIFVACVNNEPIGFLTSYLGPDCLMMGTDMCHNDAGTDPYGHALIMERKDISREAAIKIADANARRAYGIPADFTPTGATASREAKASPAPVPVRV